MTDNRNLIITVILSTIILVAWQHYYVTPRQEARQEQLRLQQEQLTQQKALQENIPQPTDLTIPHQPRAVMERKRHITIQTERLHGSILLHGARFDDLTLAKYKQRLAEDAEEVILLSPSGMERSYFAEFGWISGTSGIEVPTANTLWSADKDILGVNDPVTLSWTNPQGLTFNINITLDEHYMFSVTQSVTNTTAGLVSLYNYGRINRNFRPQTEQFFILHEGPLGVLGGTLSEIDYDDLVSDKSYKYEQTQGWLGITDKYWLTALIPDNTNSFNANFSYNMRQGKPRFQSDFLSERRELLAGDSFEATHHLFAGAKEVTLLDRYSEELNIPLFDRAVDLGWLYFLTKPILIMLKWLFALVGNFGVAILLLTVVIRIILFPLANKSFVAMSQMKELQPKIIEFKEQYKDDRVKMNQAIMDLYKKEKVNPLSGCLPLLVQLPIFFALYKVLFVTIEMRHAPFYGWIQDLSAPDPTSIFNAFGLIPWDPPGILMIGIWPILMGITMYFQQKLNPQPADPMQAKIMKTLPFIFVFLFASFPAGLVIYWAWNNCLSVIQQWVITRKVSRAKRRREDV